MISGHVRRCVTDCAWSVLEVFFLLSSTEIDRSESKRSAARFCRFEAQIWLRKTRRNLWYQEIFGLTKGTGSGGVKFLKPFLKPSIVYVCLSTPQRASGTQLHLVLPCRLLCMWTGRLQKSRIFALVCQTNARGLWTGVWGSRASHAREDPRFRRFAPCDQRFREKTTVLQSSEQATSYPGVAWGAMTRSRKARKRAKKNPWYQGSYPGKNKICKYLYYM